MTWYHISPKCLPIGFEISPGTWWKRILSAEDKFKYQREIELEAYRKMYCPEKPSRLECAFAWPNKDACATFFEKTCYKQGFIYEVKPKFDNYSFHIGCLNCLDLSYERRCSTPEEEFIDFYWNYEERVDPMMVDVAQSQLEVITTSPLIVVREIKPSESF